MPNTIRIWIQKAPNLALLGFTLMSLNSECSLAMRRDGHIIRSRQNRPWEVHGITVDQTSRPGYPDQLGSVEITLELADQRQLRIHLDQRLSPPTVEMSDASSCSARKQVYVVEEWELTNKPRNKCADPEFVIRGLRYETVAD